MSQEVREGLTPPVNIKQAVDGDSILLKLDNTQPNEASSTNETSQIRFGFGSDQNVGAFNFGKEKDYTSSANSDSFFSILTDKAGTLGERLRIDSNGNVGIGTTNPDDRLHIDKAVDGSSIALRLENSQINAISSINETSEISFSFGGVNDAAKIVAGKILDFTNSGNQTSYIAFHTRQSGVVNENMRIDPSGQIAIGRTLPRKLLDLSANSIGNISCLLIENSETNEIGSLDESASITFGFGGVIDVGQLRFGKDDHYAFGANQSSFFSVHTDKAGTLGERLRIDSDGNVGIGTTSPDDRLHIDKAVDGSSIALRLENSQANATSSINETSEISFSFGGVNDVAKIVAGKELDYTSSANEDSFLALYTDLNGVAGEALRITSGKQLGVGTIAPHQSALVDISSTTKGFRPPNMTTAQFNAISTKGAGLIAFDTDKSKWVGYDGSNQVVVGRNDITCHVYHNVDQSISSNVSTPISFNSESYDPKNMHSNTTNNSRITISEPGKYLCLFTGSVQNYSSGIRQISFRVNGTTNYSMYRDDPISTIWYRTTSIQIDLLANDYVEVIFYQTSGVSLYIYSNERYSPDFIVTLISN